LLKVNHLNTGQIMCAQVTCTGNAESCQRCRSITHFSQLCVSGGLVLLVLSS
jgi:hypothetical protein